MNYWQEIVNWCFAWVLCFQINLSMMAVMILSDATIWWMVELIWWLLISSGFLWFMWFVVTRFVLKWTLNLSHKNFDSITCPVENTSISHPFEIQLKKPKNTKLKQLYLFEDLRMSLYAIVLSLSFHRNFN